MCKDLQQNHVGLKSIKTKIKKEDNPSSTFLAMTGQIAKVIEHLNNLTGRRFALHGENANCVGAALTGKGHLHQKYTVEELKLVIDHKVAEWGGDDVCFSDGKPGRFYLRPKTLFSYKNLADYLEEAQVWKNGLPKVKQQAVERKVVVRDGPPV